MLQDQPLIAFVATTQPARAKAFYGQVLGLRLEGESPFALEFSAGGTRLRVIPVRAFTPAEFTVLGWLVPDLPAAVERLVAQGGTSGAIRA